MLQAFIFNLIHVNFYYYLCVYMYDMHMHVCAFFLFINKFGLVLVEVKIKGCISEEYEEWKGYVNLFELQMMLQVLLKE